MSDNDTANQLAGAPQIDGIEILDLLGKGGMSVVYKARQKQLDRIVAVKVLSRLAFQGEEGLKRFQKEAKLTSMLKHPNIVTTISFGVSTDEQPYLLMEYLEGLSLADELKQNGRLSLRKFKDVFLPVLSALEQAQQLGLVHRDLKPENIMLCRTETGPDTVKLLDFGIAKFFSGDANETLALTKTGTLLGTPRYMSPEQCRGEALDGRSDLYSLACVMYESLVGQPPFPGDSALEIMQKHCWESPPTVQEMTSKVEIDMDLAKLTLSGLNKDPASRPQSASEFAQKLNMALQGITLDKVPKLKIAAAAGTRTLRIALIITFAGVSLLILNFAAQIAQNQSKQAGADLKTLNAKHKMSDREIRNHDQEKEVKHLEEEYRKARLPAERSDCLQNLINQMDKLAETQSGLGKYGKSRMTIRKELSLLEEDGQKYTFLKARILTDLGFYAGLDGDLPGAFQAYDNALAFVNNSTSGDARTTLLYKTLQARTNTLAQHRKYSEALPELERLTKLWKEHELRSGFDELERRRHIDCLELYFGQISNQTPSDNRQLLAKIKFLIGIGSGLHSMGRDAAKPLAMADEQLKLIKLESGDSGALAARISELLAANQKLIENQKMTGHSRLVTD